MKKISLAIALLIMPTLAHAWPWSMDMANGVSIKPQESVDIKNPGMTPFPKRSVPVAGTTQFVKDQDAALKLVNPVPADDKSVVKGGQLFAIYCVACHGKSGTGDGLVGAKLMLRPFDLTSTGNLKMQPDGHIFSMMTFGGAVMPAYANDLSATERWHVVNYVRNVLGKMSAVETAAVPAK